MSLTSLLRGTKPKEKEFQTILREILPSKEMFQTLSRNKAFSKKEYEELVPYHLSKHDNASVIGTAFDYLARIMLARVVPRNREDAYSDLAAQGGIYVLSRFTKRRPSLQGEIQDRYQSAVNNAMKFTKNNQDINGLIEDVCFLAKLERIGRTGMPPMDIFNASFFDAPHNEVVTDLKQLIDVFQDKFLPLVRPSSEIIYNPNFGIASACVGGADSDVYIDGTLYDFKTGKQIGYKWQEVAQLIGYYLLNEISYVIDGVDNSSEDPYPYLDIKHLAFYRGRFGEVEYIDISSLDKEKLNAAENKLVTYFAENPILNAPMMRKFHIIETFAKK